mmetsp:Transcript_29959/g.42747  ORF Transcript_29959/g.42747 Transcript_29959/m.42747 type:complete len:235 (+) Transcript_29959:1486-2190(+)
MRCSSPARSGTATGAGSGGCSSPCSPASSRRIDSMLLRHTSMARCRASTEACRSARSVLSWCSCRSSAASRACSCSVSSRRAAALASCDPSASAAETASKELLVRLLWRRKSATSAASPVEEEGYGESSGRCRALKTSCFCRCEDRKACSRCEKHRRVAFREALPRTAAARCSRGRSSSMGPSDTFPREEALQTPLGRSLGLADPLAVPTSTGPPLLTVRFPAVLSVMAGASSR